MSSISIKSIELVDFRSGRSVRQPHRPSRSDATGLGDHAPPAAWCPTTGVPPDALRSRRRAPPGTDRARSRQLPVDGHRHARNDAGHVPRSGQARSQGHRRDAQRFSPSAPRATWRRQRARGPVPGSGPCRRAARAGACSSTPATPRAGSAGSTWPIRRPAPHRARQQPAPRRPPRRARRMQSATRPSPPPAGGSCGSRGPISSNARSCRRPVRQLLAASEPVTLFPPLTGRSVTSSTADPNR